MNTEHTKYMQRALDLAKKAASENEVPIGAVIVKDQKIIGEGYNLRETEQNVLRHAELIAIDQACKKLNSWRLNDAVLYVTLEPCLMCAGAIYQARISKVIFATEDPKGGACGSLYQVQSDTRLNHRFETESGILRDECAEILKDFFKKKRG